MHVSRAISQTFLKQFGCTGIAVIVSQNEERKKTVMRCRKTFFYIKYLLTVSQCNRFFFFFLYIRHCYPEKNFARFLFTFFCIGWIEFANKVLPGCHCGFKDAEDANWARCDSSCRSPYYNNTAITTYSFFSGSARNLSHRSGENWWLQVSTCNDNWTSFPECWKLSFGEMNN